LSRDSFLLEDVPGGDVHRVPPPDVAEAGLVSHGQDQVAVDVLVADEHGRRRPSAVAALMAVFRAW
jgi:hypothetical protein